MGGDVYSCVAYIRRKTFIECSEKPAHHPFKDKEEEEGALNAERLNGPNDARRTAGTHVARGLEPWSVADAWLNAVPVLWRKRMRRLLACLESAPTRV